MFDNIGKKIKGFATFLTWVGIICSVITGIILLIAKATVVGFAVMLIGSLSSWVSSFILYGFGQIVSSNESAAYYEKQNYEKLKNIESELNSLIKAQQEKENK